MGSEPQTVLQVIATLAPGGAERVVVDLCRHLDRDRFRPIICHLYPPSDLGQTLEAQGLEIAGPLATRRADPRLPWRLAAVVRRYRPALVHVHLAPCGLWYAAAYLLRLSRVPFIYTHHNVYTALPAYARLSLPVIHRLASWITCVSEGSAKSLLTKFGSAEGRYSVIYNGIRPSRILAHRPRDEVRAGLGVDFGHSLICNLANIRPSKGQDTLLRAFHEVHLVCDASHLIIAGDTEAHPGTTRALKALVAQHDLEDCAQFLGTRTDVPDLLAACDVFVLSSRQEGFPITILEAMAAGKPVVTTNVGGCAEAVIDGDTGLVVPPGSPQALAEALVYLLTHPDEAQRMGEAGRRRVEEHFTVEAMVRQNAELYTRLSRHPA